MISALKGINDDIQLEDGMELSTVLDWLTESLMKKPKLVNEIQPIESMKDFLERIGKVKIPKKPNKYSQITRDGT